MNRPNGTPNQTWGVILILIALGIVFTAAIWIGQIEGGPFAPIGSPTATRFVPEFKVVTPEGEVTLVGEATLIVSTVVVTAVPIVVGPTATLDPALPSPTPAPTMSAEELVSGIVDPSCFPFAPPGWTSAVVNPGDTLTNLSIRTGTTVQSIVEANCIVGDRLFVGDQLFLPIVPPTRFACTPPTSPPAGWEAVVVQRGDTLFSLSRSRGTTFTEVQVVNCLLSVAIQAGQTLFLPISAGQVPTATATSVPTSPTDTPQATAVPTQTPQATSTIAPTQTLVPTPVPTNTPGSYPVATDTPTALPSATPTETPIATYTSTSTPSPVPTATATETLIPSATPSETPTLTATPSETPTEIPTSTPTATETIAATPTPP